MYYCPVCSNIDTPELYCHCGNLMQDNGPVTDYFGPYSPYFNTEFESSTCEHLFTCPDCGNDTVISIELKKQ